MRRIAQAANLFATLLLAGCAGGQSLLGTETTASATADVAMPGRWILVAPDAPFCGMNFSAAPGTTEGTVVPEGGCPGNFFTSRRWTLNKNTLTITDDEKQTLATLTFANGQFEGRSVNDLPVTLKR